MKKRGLVLAACLAIAAASLPAIAASTPDSVKILRDKYGVPLRIAEDLADPVRKLPSEYAALGTLPQPWSVTDSIAFASVGLSIFGAEGGHEVQNACLLSNMTARLHSENEAKGVFNDLFW